MILGKIVGDILDRYETTSYAIGREMAERRGEGKRGDHTQLDGIIGGRIEASDYASVLPKLEVVPIAQEDMVLAATGIFAANHEAAVEKFALWLLFALIGRDAVDRRILAAIEASGIDEDRLLDRLLAAKRKKYAVDPMLRRFLAIEQVRGKEPGLRDEVREIDRMIRHFRSRLVAAYIARIEHDIPEGVLRIEWAREARHLLERNRALPIVGTGGAYRLDREGATVRLPPVEERTPR